MFIFCNARKSITTATFYQKEEKKPNKHSCCNDFEGCPIACLYLYYMYYHLLPFDQHESGTRKKHILVSEVYNKKLSSCLALRGKLFRGVIKQLSSCRDIRGNLFSCVIKKIFSCLALGGKLFTGVKQIIPGCLAIRGKLSTGVMKI